MKTRNPAVEGRFYPGTREKLFAQIRSIEQAGRYPDPDPPPDGRILGAVLPHAGHVYSGYQTVPFFRLLARQESYPECFVIVHPNHTGLGAPLAVDDSETWLNSAGEVPVDRAFAGELDLPFDSGAHAGEHSGEVILPYIQYYLADHPFTIVPVCMGTQDLHSAQKVAAAVASAEMKTSRRIMVLASSDFSHFLSPEHGKRMDQYVVDAILAGDCPGIESAIRKHRISMCGYGPVMALLSYAALQDPAYKIRMLARGHSGEVIPSREVVDYISFLVHT